MSHRHPPVASIFAPNFPLIGWAGALSSLIHTLGHHSGHFKMIPGKEIIEISTSQ